MSDDAGFYAVLEVPRNASQSDIRRAYKQMAVKWHPDKNPQNPQHAGEMFKKVSRAYEVLSNPETRQTYDRYGMAGLEQGRAPPSSGPSSFNGASPFGGSSAGRNGGGSSAGAAPHWEGFHDPFDVFRQFFGNSDPFASMFEDPFFGGGGGGSPFGSMLGGGMFGRMGGGMGGGMFGDMMMAGGGNGGGFSFSSSSMTSSSGFGGGGKSVSQTTQVVNGRKVTKTITRTTLPDGTFHEDVDEQIEELPQRVEGGAAPQQRPQLLQPGYYATATNAPQGPRSTFMQQQQQQQHVPTPQRSPTRTPSSSGFGSTARVPPPPAPAPSTYGRQSSSTAAPRTSSFGSSNSSRAPQPRVAGGAPSVHARPLPTGAASSGSFSRR